MLSTSLVGGLLAGLQLVSAQSSATRIIPTLSPQINAAPSLTPTILDPTAPDAQKCPGYKASGVQQVGGGFTADLTIAGANCQAYGNDIHDLKLEVSYQTKERINVRIYPAHIAEENRTQYFIPDYIVPQPAWDGSTTSKTSDLRLDWSNDPTFQFRICRASTNEELFSTYGHVLVFEDQFIEIVSNMVPNYNLYGLAENAHDFLLSDNYTQTFYAVDAGNSIDYNSYGTHPFYQETRYHDGANTTAHGVYARNAHGQEWLLRPDVLHYRTIGGSVDMYFLSGQDSSGGSSAKTTIAQYQTGCIGTPAMQMFWTFGFHQCRWGYENISVLQTVRNSYAEANIPLECLWNDLDIYELYRDFTNNEVTYPAAPFRDFINNELHANNQYYVPIIDSNIYAPNPTNASDAYEPWSRAASLGTFIRDPTTGNFYFGDNWPGFSCWADWLLPSSQDWWTYETSHWHSITPYDGIWIDLSEASSFCVGSCGNGRLDENPVHPPFLLPGDPLTLEYRYPEGFNVSNATEAASASAAASAQASSASVSPVLPAATTTTQGRTNPTPGVRHLNFPPYVLNHVQAGHSLLKSAIAPNATHNDPSNTTEYEMHNLFGHQISNATYEALLSIFPGRRPFTVGRSTFASSGRFTSHWGGDNTSTWGSMFLGISQALTFMMAGIPMFGPDTCGFAGNTDYDLCSRWMALSAFMPFYRNHNIKAAIGQEAYHWSSVAEASRRAMAVRYSTLNYMYTLFYHAHTAGQTVLRALAWEFPEDQSLLAVYAQFMVGPAILVTPVLEPNVDYVRGVFPGIKQGTRWYDWYTLDEVDAQPGENKTLDAPLEKINVFVRGGYVIPLQAPGLTTADVRNSSWGLLAALNPEGQASGDLYLDDGVSLVQAATKYVTFSYASGCLNTQVNGTYSASQPLTNVTVAGLSAAPKGVKVTSGGAAGYGHNKERDANWGPGGGHGGYGGGHGGGGGGWGHGGGGGGHGGYGGGHGGGNGGGNNGGGNCASAKLSYADGVARVTGLEGCTSGGAWANNLQICLT